MAIDNSFPEWMLPRMTPWQNLALGAQVGAQIAQARYRNQALKVQVEQQAQQDVLRMRELELRRNRETAINELRLQKMEDDEAEAADLPMLQQYARNPDAGIPAFKSPKSFARLAQIDAARTKTALEQQRLKDDKDLNDRLVKIPLTDRLRAIDMMRAGRPMSEVAAVIDDAAEKMKSDVIQEPIYGPNGEFLGMAVTGKGTKLITNIGRMSDVDKLEYNAAQKELQALNKNLGDALNYRLLQRSGKLPEQEQRRSALQQKLGEIISKYEPPEPASATPAPTPATTLPKPQNQADIDEVIRQANEAIKRGKDPAAVRQRLREMGIQIQE